MGKGKRQAFGKAKVKRQKAKERRMRGTARLSSSTVDESDAFRPLLFCLFTFAFCLPRRGLRFFHFGLRRLFLARLDGALVGEAEALAYELLGVLLDEFAADDPGALREEVARLVELGGFEEDVEGRAPVARVADGLTVAVVRRLVARLARLGLDDDRVGRAALRLEKLARVVCRGVLAPGDPGAA